MYKLSVILYLLSEDSGAPLSRILLKMKLLVSCNCIAKINQVPMALTSKTINNSNGVRNIYPCQKLKSYTHNPKNNLRMLPILHNILHIIIIIMLSSMSRISKIFCTYFWVLLLIFFSLLLRESQLN